MQEVVYVALDVETHPRSRVIEERRHVRRAFEEDERGVSLGRVHGAVELVARVVAGQQVVRHLPRHTRVATWWRIGRRVRFPLAYACLDDTRHTAILQHDQARGDLSTLADRTSYPKSARRSMVVICSNVQ
jgi:hypothetical protein